MPLFTSGDLGLGLVILVLPGLKNLVLFTSLSFHHWLCEENSRIVLSIVLSDEKFNFETYIFHEIKNRAIFGSFIEILMFNYLLEK